MQAVLFEDKKWTSFLPLVYTRPVGALRVGIFTIAEKWQRALNVSVAHRSRQEMRGLFEFPSDKEQIQINARVLPTDDLLRAIQDLKEGQALVKEDLLIVSKTLGNGEDDIRESIVFHGDLLVLESIPDLFLHNGRAIILDLPYWKQEAEKSTLSESNQVIGDASLLLIAKGANAEGCIFNTTAGPIIIDEDAEVMEGSMIRGPFYLGKHATVRMGAKIYGSTTIGPECKVGGEVSNSVIFGYSNKAHDGFLGNSVIGEWCNLGADTNNSNLKNNYSNVKIWSYEKMDYVDTGLTFCGLIMGDHAKSAINTQFNTGTVVGPFANIAQSGFPPKYIPAFSWGDESYDFQKAMQTAEKVFARRNLSLTKEYQELYANILKEE